MSVHTVARRYATALADVLANSHDARSIQDELTAWEEMMKANDSLVEVFGNPTVPYDQKLKVLRALISKTRVTQTTANFLQILLRNQRLTELGEVNKRFARILDERSGVVSAQVTTARPVSRETQDALSSKLASLTGKKVRLDFGTDESLLGGIVTRIGSTIYDGSVRNQLEQVQERLAGKG